MATAARIEVESGVPIPSRHHRTLYPFGEMAVGDSFFVPDVKAAKVSNAFGSYCRHHPGVKFTSRTVDGGVRVWRIA